MLDSQSLDTRFEFRTIRTDEADQAIEMEKICFPPNEACSAESVRKRVEAMPGMFLVACDRNNGRIAGYVTGVATDETGFRDDFFDDTGLYKRDGRVNMLLGLEVLPQYRKIGLATELMRRYLIMEKERGRKVVILTCNESHIGMYEKMGYHDLGISASVFGGEIWHDMEYLIR